MKTGNLIVGLILVIVGAGIAVNGNSVATEATSCNNSFLCLLVNSSDNGASMQNQYDTGIGEILVGVIVGIVGLVLIATAFQGRANTAPPQAFQSGSASVPSSRFCSNCGSPVKGGARFCGMCGAQV